MRGFFAIVAGVLAMLPVTFVPRSSAAQDATRANAGVRTLSFSEVLRIARRNPPAVTAAIARARAASARVDIARAPLRPSVDGTGTASVVAFHDPSERRLVNVDVDSGHPGGIYGAATLEAAINARWTFVDFGRTSRDVTAARAGALGERENARATELTAVAEAAAAFFVLLSDQELVAQVEETVRQRGRQFDIARGLVAAGARAPIEETRASVALEAAQLDLTVAQATVQSDAATLAAALGLDPLMTVRVVRPQALVVEIDPARAARLSVRNMPELAAGRARLAEAEARVAVARGGYLPSLGANGSASAQYEPYGENPGSSSETPTASLVFSAPIYDGSVRSNVRAAEATLAESRAQLDEQSLQVRARAVQAAIAARSAERTLAQSERLAAGAAANLRQAEGRYEAGAATLLELVDAQAEDASARVGVVRNRFQLELAKVRLLEATGTLITR